jgi:hypothetical protein
VNNTPLAGNQPLCHAHLPPEAAQGANGFSIGGAMKLYRICDWNELYECNRTRELKHMQWLPVPVKLDGDGYAAIMEQPDGPALYGTWYAILQVAARCKPRGILQRGAGIPHDGATLARLSRIKVREIERALNFFTNEVQWIEYTEVTKIPQEGAEKSQEGAGIPHDGALQDSTGSTDITNTTRKPIDIQAAGMCPHLRRVISAYPKAVPERACFREWAVLLSEGNNAQELADKIIKALSVQAPQWKQQDIKFTPELSRYLKDGMWTAVNKPKPVAYYNGD